MKFNVRLALLFALACAAVAAFTVGGAAAATPAPGYAVTDWSAGNANNGAVGPVGVAADPNNPSDIYVMNYASGTLYRYDQATGGTEGPAHQVSQLGEYGVNNAAGIAFDKEGRLYVALQAWWQVAEISKVDGHMIRTLASPYGVFYCATGIATDPLSGDLFVTSPCGWGTIRIPTSGDGSGSAVGPAIDGITFGPDGTIWGEGGGWVYKMPGTNKPDYGTYTAVAYVPWGDGISVAAAADDPSLPPYVFVVRNDGIITKVDLSGPSPAYTDIVTGGTRGDFSTVGYDGCLYATQTDRVIKVTNADGSCSLAPITPDDATSLVLTAPASDDFNDTITVSATLTNVSKSLPLAGQTVAFTLGSAGCSATTGATGVATCSLTIADPAGPATLKATFAHQPKLAPAITTAPFTITLEETTLTYTGATGTLLNTTSVTLSGVLQEDGTTPLAGRTVTFTLGTGGSAQSCAATTSATGAAACSVVVNQPSGATTISASYAGDAFYVPATASAAANVIVSARVLKQGALDALNGLVSPGGKKSDDDDNRVSNAAKKIARSLTPAWWADGVHLTLNGCGVFDNEKAAASQLRELLKSKKLSAADKATIRSVIDALVLADQILATTAVNEATAAGGTAKKLALANAALAKAAALVAAGKPDEAINQYRVAWEKAQESQGRKVCGDDGHEDEDGHDGGHRDSSGD